MRKSQQLCSDCRLIMNTFLIITIPLFASALAFIKPTGCETKCSVSFCTDDKRENCDLTNHEFIEKDNDCFCCDRCIRTKFGLDCSGVKCQYPDGRPTKESCVKQGLKFRPIDEFTCCDTCQPEELGVCAKVEVICVTVSEDICKKKGKVFVAADGFKICCDHCEDQK